MFEQKRLLEDNEESHELFELTAPFRLSLLTAPFCKHKTSLVPAYLASSFTKEEIDNLCDAAFKFFSEKKYNKAFSLFKEVCHYNYLDERGWIGLGTCYKEFNKFNLAIECYSMASMINIQNPYIFLKVYDCYISLKNYDGAIGTAEAILTIMENEKEPPRSSFKEFATGLKYNASNLKLAI